jgi:hypothetical protein
MAELRPAHSDDERRLVLAALREAGFDIDGSPSAVARAQAVADSLAQVSEARLRTELERRASERLTLRTEAVRSSQERDLERARRVAAEEEVRHLRDELAAERTKIASAQASEIGRLHERVRRLELRLARQHGELARIGTRIERFFNFVRGVGRGLLAAGLLAGTTISVVWIHRGLSAAIWTEAVTVGTVATVGLAAATWTLFGRKRAKQVLFWVFVGIQALAALLQIASQGRAEP